MKYNPALDGLRGLFALLVLLFHAGFPLTPGGNHGVDGFFVLSGYLITAILMAEFETAGRVNFFGFWLRRLRRLMPLLVVASIGYVAVAPFLYAPAIASWRWRDLVATLTYTYPLDTVIAPRDTGMAHMWSLGLEAQFYLIWPLVLPLVHGMRKPWVALLSVFVAVTALRMWGQAVVLPAPIEPLLLPLRPSGLLLGAALAYAPPLPRWLGGMGLLLLVAEVLLDGPWMSPFWRESLGVTGCELATAALICGLTGPGRMTRVLSSPWIVRLGLISYGIYVWHFPFAKAMTGLFPWPEVVVVTLGLTLALATLSYLLVERPMQSLRLSRAGASAPEAAS